MLRVTSRTAPVRRSAAGLSTTALLATFASLSAATVALGDSPGNAGDLPPEAVVLGVLFVLMLAVVFGLAIQLVVCLLLVGPLKAVPEPMRRISTGQVWLLMIPIFATFWNFRVYPAISESIKAAGEERGLGAIGDGGRQLGLIYAILVAVAIVGSFIPVLNCFSGFASVAALVLQIVYLVKIHGFKAQLLAGSAA
jgi:hypothetical protein